MEALTAILREPGTITAPKLGVFAARVAAGDRVRPGTVLGTLRVLNREYSVIAPQGSAGVVEKAPSSRHDPVGYGDVLFTLGSDAGIAIAASALGAKTDAMVDGVVVSAPITGIFYRRAAPSTPVYVEIGQAVANGQTVGLIEVMKTFNPVVYTGAPGVVAAIPAGDRQEVVFGQPLVIVKA